MDGEFFTNDRFLELLEQPIASAADLLEQVDKRVHEHIGKAAQFDDITMLVLRRKPETEITSRAYNYARCVR